MQSDIIHVDSHGAGFSAAEKEATKVAAYDGLDRHNTTRLKLITEEMLSLVRMVTGETDMSFWIEIIDGLYQLHLSTKTLMDSEKRYLLIASSSSRKNDAAKSLLGKLRDKFEEALLAEPALAYPGSNIPLDLAQDIFYHPLEDPEWDKYERSVLKKLADDIKISIRGDKVDITISKRFA